MRRPQQSCCHCGLTTDDVSGWCLERIAEDGVAVGRWLCPSCADVLGAKPWLCTAEDIALHDPPRRRIPGVSGLGPTEQ